jgi:RHS repeat-associated protein
MSRMFMYSIFSNDKVKTCLVVGCLMFALAYEALGQTTTLTRYACTDQATSTLIYDYIKAGKSDGFCDQGTQLKVISTPSSLATVTVTRLGSDDHRAQVNIAWVAGQTGTLTIEVQYRKRVYDKWLSCKWTSWRDLYTYVVKRSDISPGNVINGTTVGTAPNDETLVTFNLNYAPTAPEFLSYQQCDFSTGGTVPLQACGLQALKIKYENGKDDNQDQIPDVVETNLAKSGAAYVAAPITYYAKGRGSYNLDVQVLVQINGGCPKWYSVPRKILQVNSSCYMDEFSSTSINLTGPNVEPHEEPKAFGVEQGESYTLSIDGITNFSSHYSLSFADFGQDVTVSGNTFTPLKKGSYIINVIAFQTDCPSPPAIPILVDDESLTITSDCPITLPADIGDFYPDIETTDVVLEHFAANVESKGNIIINPGMSLELGAELFAEPGFGPNETDLDKNFTEQTSYDEFGGIILESRSYVDERGNSLQTQYKNFSNDVILANATLYDALGRAAISTLDAPVIAGDFLTCAEDPDASSKIEFLYKPDFVKSTTGIYSYLNFDIGKELNPDPLGNSEKGTLGWYYSLNNGSTANDKMNEPLVATSQFPYSRTLYKSDGTGAEGVTKPGDHFKAGSGYISKSEQQPVDDNDSFFDMSDKSYLSIRQRELGLSRPVSIDGEFFKTSSTDEVGKRSVTYTDKSGKNIISVYYGTGTTPITTTYSFYDYADRLILSISPNGLNQYSINNNVSNFSEIDKTRYFYNAKGLLSAIEEKIAGQAADGISRTEYVYRNDGKIRFSQNHEQRNAVPAKYSYTNYDRAGRAIESGEYETGVGSIGFKSNEMTAILENVNDDGGISDTQGNKKDRSFSFYDLPDVNIPLGRVQRFVYGSISYSKKDNEITTWYSYDERGRIEWMIQDIAGFGTKTIDYRYGSAGQVQEIIYQKGIADEQFTHFYEYDADTRLSKVYTTRELLVYDIQGKLTNSGISYDAKGYIENAGILEHQATYTYYLHGPLKRVELADRFDGGNKTTLQGIDYLYTIDGVLKAINGSDKLNDPGHDGAGSNAHVQPDVFGFTLDYFAGDYQPAQGTVDAVTYTGGYPDQHTGLIKAMRWHSPIESDKVFGYAYEYDARNQFKKAHWAKLNGTTFTADPLLPYQEAVNGYDANGNIFSLQRNGNILKPTSNFNYDLNYSYKANSNILESITQPGTTEDFRSYSYDDLGRMTVQTAGEDVKYLTYDVSGKVTGVYEDANHSEPVTEFKYDDRGFRLSKKTFDEDHQLILTTWYVRDATGNIISTYETDHSVSQVAVPTEMPVYGSGRIGLFKPNFGITLYELTDHLGNVRAVLGDKIEVEYMATMESERTSEEVKDFQNIDPAPTADYINHTPKHVVVDNQSFEIANNDEVNRLNNRPAGIATPDPIGTGIMLLVHPGDVINAEVFAKYVNFDANNTNILSGLTAFLAATFTTAPIVDGTSIFSITATPEFAALPAWSKLDESKPQAFLNYLLFDNNFKLQENGFDFAQVTSAAEIPSTNPYVHQHERLQLEVEIKKEGYIYVYVSNQSDQNMDVYFDDLNVKHKYSNIVAGGDYYPYGLPITDRQINRESYRFGYQGQYAESDNETGWNHFELREYDPFIGRWLVPDPAKQYHSPYVAYGNDPINRVDPDGGCDTGDCPDNDGWGPSPESLKFQLYLAHMRALATPEPGIMGSMWQATKDFGSDMADGTVGLFTGETYTKIWEAVEFEWKYPGFNQVSDMAYTRDLLAGNIPANQIAYDFTYSALSYGSAIIAPEVGGMIGSFGLNSLKFGFSGALARSSTFGVRSRLFGSSFFRGKGNSGLLNYGNTRLGWSFNNKTSALEFTFRRGSWHSPTLFKTTNIPPK